MKTLSQLKDALAALGVSTETKHLRGEARRDELARRLQHARVSTGVTDLDEDEAGGENDVQKLTMSELRSALELREISTRTPGQKGDARRHALVQRLMNFYDSKRRQTTNESGSSCDFSVHSTSRVGSSDEEDDAKSETSSSVYSTANEFIFYDAVETDRKKADPERQKNSKLMPQLSFTRLKVKERDGDSTEKLQEKLFELRAKLHTARQEQQHEIQLALREAGIETSLSNISTQLQALERERRRLEENFFAHELVTSEVLHPDTPGGNQAQLEFIQEDAIVLIDKRQEALKQQAERTKEAMAVAKFHAFQAEPAKMESARQAEEAVLKHIQHIESCLHSGESQRALPATPQSYNTPPSDLNTPVLARFRSMPNGLQHELWGQMDANERRELHFELQTAASFHIRRDRVSINVSNTSDSSSAVPSQADKLGMKARFMEKSRRNPEEIIQVYEKALEVDDHHAENLGSFALFLCTSCDQMDQAQELFKRALAADPGNVRNLANYANFLKCERRDFTESELCYKEAVKSAPRDANILGGYADLLTMKSQGNRDDLLFARRILKKALGISPANIQNQLRLALVLADLKEDEASQRCFQQLILAMELKNDPDQCQSGRQRRKEHDTLAFIYENYANCLCKCGQWARAKQVYGKALALDPQRPSLLRNL